MGKEKGIIWDVDGVLAKTAPFHCESWRKVWKERNIEFSWDDFKMSFGMRNDRIILEMLGRDYPEEEIAYIAKKKEYYFRKVAKGRIKPPTGLTRLLASLKNDGFRMAVASSGPPENVEFILKECNLTSFFLSFVSGSEVSHSKPHPEIFLLASRRISVEPHQCIVVEDAPAGVKGAKKAKMKCIAITTLHSKDELKEADMIINSFTEVNIEKFNQLILNKE